MIDEHPTYQPHLWTVEKDTVYAAIRAVDNGLEYARGALTEHDKTLGRTTQKNRMNAERMLRDIWDMEATLEKLRAEPHGG